MDSDRFDAVARSLAQPGSRRRLLGGLVAAVASVRPGAASAQVETAAAGNGGTGDASANGGAVGTGTVNSGGNAGSATGVGDTVGGVAVDGGAAANSTSLDVATEGGTGIADASGGNENIAFIDETCPNVGACTGVRNDCGPAESECACWPTTEGAQFVARTSSASLGRPARRARTARSGRRAPRPAVMSSPACCRADSSGQRSLGLKAVADGRQPADEEPAAIVQL